MKKKLWIGMVLFVVLSQTAFATVPTSKDILFLNPYGIDIDEKGNVWVVDQLANTLINWMPSGVKAQIGKRLEADLYGDPIGGRIDTVAMDAVFNKPRALCIVGDKMFIADTENHVIRMVYKGNVYTFAGTGLRGYKDGLAKEAQFNTPTDIKADSKGNLYVADTLNHVIRKITPEGIVSTFAGEKMENGGYLDGNALKAHFNEPSGIALDQKDGVFVADTGNQLIRFISKGQVETYAGKYSQERISDTNYALPGYEDGLRQNATFNFPKALTVAPDGWLYVADTRNDAIRSINPMGEVQSVKIEGIEMPQGLAYHKDELYVTDGGSKKIVTLKFLKNKDQYVQVKGLVNKTFIYKNQSLVTPIDEAGYVPLRKFMELIGGKVKYDAKSKMLNISRGTLSIWIASSNEQIKNINNELLVPLEMLEKNFKLKIVKNTALQTYVIE